MGPLPILAPRLCHQTDRKEGPNEWLLGQPFTSRRSQLPPSCRPHRRSLVDQRITRRKKTLESTTCIIFASSHSGLIRYFRKPTPHPGGAGQTKPAFFALQLGAFPFELSFAQQSRQLAPLASVACPNNPRLKQSDTTNCRPNHGVLPIPQLNLHTRESRQQRLAEA